MSFVDKVSETDAGPELKPLYERIRENYGFVPNYFQALGHAPQVVKAHLDLSSLLAREGALPAPLKEQIVLVVSGINSSSYCVAAHMEVLRRLGVEKALGRKLATDYASAPVGTKEMALFRFADKLTRNQSEIEETDADAVFQAGWEKAALIETVLTVAWANFINRVSFGLGLFADF
jgi:uncharacterized peroxidase-related enzyme